MAGEFTSPTTGWISHSAGAGARGGGDGGGMVLGGADEEIGAGPLGGLGDAVGSVLHAAGYRGAKPAGDKTPDESGSESTAPQPTSATETLGGRSTYPSDADAPSQAVFTDSGGLYHMRNNGDGSASVRYLGRSAGEAPGPGPAY